MLRLSIVIPFYNVEKYIGDCLDSVYNQDIPENEYEVICVNDASPDGSRDIVLGYQKVHQNLVLVEHEVNKKLGAARNSGRKVAKGRYIWNVDSDDRIAPMCLGKVLEKCETYDLDVFLFCFDTIVNGEQKERIRPWGETEEPCTGIDFWKQQALFHQSEIAQVWTQVYRREYLDVHQIVSPEINMAEDESFTYSSILQAKRLMVSNTPYYCFRENPNSLTSTLKKAPTPDLLYEDGFYSGRLMRRILTIVPKNETEVRKSIKNMIRYSIMTSFDKFPSLSEDSRKQYKQLCRCGFISNVYVFFVLNRKQILRYLSFLLFD